MSMLYLGMMVDNKKNLEILLLVSPYLVTGSDVTPFFHPRPILDMQITKSCPLIAREPCHVIFSCGLIGYRPDKPPLLLLSPIDGEQGWCSGESARLPPMCPGFDSWTLRHMWVEFVVGSLLCSERFFSGYSGFPLSKTNISKFQFDP